MTTPLSRKDKRGAIAWMAGNSVASNLLMFMLLVGGVFFAYRIKQEWLPEFSLDIVTVSVAYPGASPEEVENGIVLVLEEAVRGLDGVKKVTATAAEGAGIVVVHLLEGTDEQKVYQDIQQEVNRISSFPEEAERPEIVLQTHRQEVLIMSVHGDVEQKVLRQWGERIRDDLVQLPDVTQVDLDTAKPLEIGIEVSQENLRAYDLTLEEIASKIRLASVELPGGSIKTHGGHILLRMDDRRDYGTEFDAIPIVTRSDGTQVLLGDIAKITDGFEDVDHEATYNGKPSHMLTVYRVGDETPIEVSDAVREYIEDLKQQLPPGIDVAIPHDFSNIFRQRMELLVRNGYIGLALVFILLGLFLEMRLAFWVTMGIPISFLGAFWILNGVGGSLNMVTMFAFLIALGIVVDDAIVVGENIYEYRKQGMGLVPAAIRGAREVALPVTFSILTNCVTFMPLFFMPGIMGKVFQWIPAVVVSVFVISLVESLFVLPAHLGHSKDRRRTWLGEGIHKYQQTFSGWVARMIRNKYGPFLQRVLRNRYITLCCGVSILVVTVGFVKSGRMGMTPFPRVESDQAYVSAVLPFGTSVEVSKEVQQRLLNAAQEVAADNGGDELVQGIFAQVGASGEESTGSHLVELIVFMTEPEQRPISTGKFVELWRKRVGQIAGLESLTFQSDRGGPGAGKAITIELSHRDMDVLETACESLAASLEEFAIVRDVDDGFSPGKRQFDFRLRPEGRSLGLTAMGVARQVRSSFYGAEALRQQRGRNEIKVMVRLPEEQRVSEYDIQNLLIHTPAGREVPLREVVDIKRGRAYTSINRRDGRRVGTVTADVVPRDKADKVLEGLKKAALPDLTKEHPGLTYDFEGIQADIRESFASLATGFAIALLAVFALLAIPFRSYVQPLIIMVCIPFGLVGAVIGHVIMGYSLSIMSVMGLVALAGVVVNDSLVLIEYANRLRKEGYTAHDAVTMAGVRRFRPILLTTLTTFGGLAPMIFETSMQARFLIPMALSLGYGILFATLITLLLVPCLYLVVEDVSRLWAKSRRDDEFILSVAEANKETVKVE